MKVKNKILCIVLAFAMLFTLVSCNTLIIDGNKITKVTMTLDFYSADGDVVSSSNVKLHLYENNSPKTVAHIKNLISKGYYNGVCISSITPYFVELGEFTYDANGDLTKKDYSYGTVNGEFENNGWLAQNQQISAGSIVLKRNRGNGTDNYNSGSHGLYFLTMGSQDFSKSEYCFIGKVLLDDGEDNTMDTSASVENIDDYDRSKLNSFSIIKSLSQLSAKKVDDVSTIINYNVKTKQYYKQIVDTSNGSSEIEVFKLKEGGDLSVETDWVKLSTTEQTDFLDVFNSTNSADKFKDEYYDYLRIPYQKIIVRQMRITK